MSQEVSGAVSAPDAPISSVDPSSFDMSIGEDGQLSLEFFSQPEEPAADAPQETPAPAPEPAAPTVSRDELATMEKRYKDLQAAFTRTTQELAEIKRGQSAPQPAAPAQSPTASLDAELDGMFASLEEGSTLDMLGDAKKLKTFMRTLVDKVSEAKVAAFRQEVAPILIDRQIQEEFGQAVATHGPDFVQKLPAVRRLIAEAPQGVLLTFDQAYRLVSSASKPAETATQESPATEVRPAPQATPAASAPPATQPAPAATAEELAARAHRMTAVTAGADTGRAGGKVASSPQGKTTIRSAFEAAITAAQGATD